MLKRQQAKIGVCMVKRNSWAIYKPAVRVPILQNLHTGFVAGHLPRRAISAIQPLLSVTHLAV